MRALQCIDLIFKTATDPMIIFELFSGEIPLKQVMTNITTLAEYTSHVALGSVRVWNAFSGLYSAISK